MRRVIGTSPLHKRTMWS